MEDNAVNPLLNPLVIIKVYKYFDFGDKKSFRLVCRAWIDAILDLWRKHSKLVIKNYTQDGRRSSPPEAHDFILEYCNLYKIAEKPLLNLELFEMDFSFLPDDFPNNAQTGHEIASTTTTQCVPNLLANHFGHSLERLELVDCLFLQYEQEEMGFYHILLKSFPKLKVLSVRGPKIFTSGHISDESAFPRTQCDLTTLNLDGIEFREDRINRIFNLIPNLKNLSLRGLACDGLQVLSSPLSSSKTHILLERLGIDTLGDISTLFDIPAWITNYLEAARPPLKCLKASLPFGIFSPAVDALDFPEEPIIYKSIWNFVGNTLTSINLRIWMGMWRWCTLFTGYSIPNLTHLCLNFPEANHDAVELLHFDFGMLRGTPLLQKLHLECETISRSRIQAVGTYLGENELEWRANASNEPIVLEHMEDFRFELFHKPTEGCWRAFAEMMPNLRELQGMLDDDTEPLVRQLWPNLLKLMWSSLLRRVNFIREMGFVAMSLIRFENEWQENDWENWNGKLDHIRY